MKLTPGPGGHVEKKIYRFLGGVRNGVDAVDGDGEDCGCVVAAAVVVDGRGRARRASRRREA